MMNEFQKETGIAALLMLFFIGYFCYVEIARTEIAGRSDAGYRDEGAKNEG